MAKKKFLDASGIEYLWSKLSLQDYPNNDTLVAVINALDATKADRTELPTITIQTLTQAEYDALANKDSSVLYVITSAS